MNICILSGAPIQSNDGVGDFSFLLAESLKSHHNVILLAPNADHVKTDFVTHEISNDWGILDCKKIFKLIEKLKPRTILVQFVPQLYGLKGANPFFSILLRRLKRNGYDVITVAHEFSSPLGQNPKTIALGTAHRMLFNSVVNASSKIVSTTPFCLNLLQQRFNSRAETFHYIPVSSTIIPVRVDDQTKARLRSNMNLSAENFVVATFGNMVGEGLSLFKTFVNWFAKDNQLARFLFLGKGSDSLKEEFTGDIQRSIHATGEISDQSITQYLSIANLYAVFYPDGASTRRTSLMTGLAHGLPIVSNTGILTDSNLISSEAVYLLKNCDTEELIKFKKSIQQKTFLENMGQQARSYFDKNLSWSRIASEYCRLLNGSSQ
jgi:glycosyltransferase involved in cell wall biosynthesis